MKEITPYEYRLRTGCTYQEIADITGYSHDAVKRWFLSGHSHREPPVIVSRMLALYVENRELRQCLSSNSESNYQHGMSVV